MSPTARRKLEVEFWAVYNLVEIVTGAAPRLVEVDTPGTRGVTGKRPDAVFEDGHGQRIVVELVRLMDPSLRGFHSFVGREICAPLRSQMPGSFLLYCAHRPHMSREVAARIRGVIEQRLGTGSLPPVLQLEDGCELRWAGEEPRDLVALVTAADLPADLRPDDPQLVSIRRAFEKAVLKKAQQLANREGRRILLVNLTQSSLDRDVHVYPGGGENPIVPTWMDALKARERDRLSHVDEVYVDCGIQTWDAGRAGEKLTDAFPRILMGHGLVDHPGGWLVRVWPRPVLPV